VVVVDRRTLQRAALVELAVAAMLVEQMERLEQQTGVVAVEPHSRILVVLAAQVALA
jgi:hypothetical protein